MSNRQNQTTSELSVSLYGAQHSQAIDRFVCQQGKIASFLLMKQAAWFAWQTLQQHFPKTQEFWILCGPGNNGGDGWLVAQYAKLAGYSVQVWSFRSPDDLKNDAQSAYQEWQQLSGKFKPLQTFENKFDCQTSTQPTDVVVIDALFGTGLKRPIQGDLAKLFAKFNAMDRQHSQLRIVSLDIPSGLNIDRGHPLGIALKADLTISFLTHKFGFYTAAGPDFCGQIIHSDLGLTQRLATAFSRTTAIAVSHPLHYWLNKLPHYSKTAHKGTRGTCVLIGGNRHMAGAVQLAAKACLYSGCGLTKIITRLRHCPFITAMHPEIMCFPSRDMAFILETANAIALGPGLGKTQWAKKIWKQILQETNRPVILDADALNLLAIDAAKNPVSPRTNWVLTPHPAEAARLLNTTTQAVQHDRIKAVRQLQKTFGGVIVLKGNGSLICDGDQVELCRAGNPSMAKGGMGDVLTGTIASLLAQGLSLFDAACCGVYLHAHSADFIEHSPSFSLLPSKVPEIYQPIHPRSSS